MNAPAQKTTAQEIADDLSVFADVGTDPASIQTTANGNIVHLTRHGEPVDIVISPTGALVERTLSSETKHANFKALLASDRYGNLRDWASKQKAYLDQELNTAGQGIDVKGLLNGAVTQLSVAGIDEVLTARQESDSTRILLIDGPAGIGKKPGLLWHWRRQESIITLLLDGRQSYMSKVVGEPYPTCMI